MKRLGTAFFALMSLAGLIRVMLENPVSGHYRIFTGAARLLQQGRDPYEFDFHSVGYWFYSPSCGLFFFSLFSWMPDLLGLFCYSVLSIATLYFAIRAVLAEWGYRGTTIEWALCLIAIPIYQALIAAKIETAMMALFLFCTLRWLRGDYGWSSVIMGLLLEWKFQVAPMAGLLGLWLMLSRRVVRPLIFLGASALAWHYLPVVFLGWATVQALFAHQKASLGGFIAESFANYDNLFRFFKEIGWNLSFQESLMISAGAAVFFAGLVAWGYRRRANLTPEAPPLLALVLGSVFCVGFSPMNQNNASILGVPVFILSALVLSRPERRPLKVMTGLFLIAFHFAYSDLVPEPARVALRQYSVKAILILLYSLSAAAWIIRGRLLKVNSEASTAIGGPSGS